MNTPPRSRQLCRHAIGVVGDAEDREAPEAGRQRVLATVVGDAQRALEADAQVPAEANFVGSDRHG